MNWGLVVQGDPTAEKHPVGLSSAPYNAGQAREDLVHRENGPVRSLFYWMLTAR